MIRTFFIFGLVVTLAACSSVRTHNLWKTHFDGVDPALAYAAAKQILVEDGFVVVDESPTEFLIAVELPEGKRSRKILASVLPNASSPRSGRVEATVNIARAESGADVRFHVHSIRKHSFGPEWGTEVDDIRIHRTFGYLMKILLRQAKAAPKTEPAAQGE